MTSRKLDSDSGTLNGRERLSDWLIRHAARKAPADLGERLEEEWRADMASRSSYVSRLRFAIGCCWATQVIAFEHQPARAAATASSGGSALLALSESHDMRFYSRRSSSFVLVLALHIGVFYALFSWVTRVHAPPMSAPLVPTFIRDDHPPEKFNATPPDLTQINHRFFVPEPEWKSATNEDGPTSTVKEDLPQPPIIDTPPTPTHVVKRVMGGTGVGFPNVDDFYPGKEIRLAHQGATVVNVCVNPNGKLYSKPTIAEGSGFGGLDDAALSLAQSGSGHYRATTEDGQPVSSCYQLKVRFQLKN
jgi:hypothetical protein